MHCLLRVVLGADLKLDMILGGADHFQRDHHQADHLRASAQIKPDHARTPASQRLTILEQLWKPGGSSRIKVGSKSGSSRIKVNLKSGSSRIKARSKPGNSRQAEQSAGRLVAGNSRQMAGRQSTVEWAPTVGALSTNQQPADHSRLTVARSDAVGSGAGEPPPGQSQVDLVARAIWRTHPQTNFEITPLPTL